MRRIAGIAVLSAICVAGAGFAGAEETEAPVVEVAPAMEEVLTMRVDGEIVVDATGKVMGYELRTPVDPHFKDLIAKAVPHWSFLPPEVDGKPSAVKSDMRITLLGKKIAEGYEVKIENVLFSRAHDRDAWMRRSPGEDAREAPPMMHGDMTLTVVSMRRPQYPRDFRVKGIVTILANIAPDGHVIDATPTQCSLYSVRDMARELARACKAMEGNAAHAIKQWKMAIDTHGKPLTGEPIMATIPVQYGASVNGVGEVSAPGQWRLESRTPYRTPDWVPDKHIAQRMGTSDAFDGELMPSEGGLRLRDGQLEKVL